MKLDVSKTAEEMAQKGTKFVVKQLNRDGNLSLGGATGSTPKRLYALLADAARKWKADFSSREIWFLDEYFGKNDYYRYAINFIHNNFPENNRIPIERIYVPNGIYYFNNQVVHSDLLSRTLQENPEDYDLHGPEIRIKESAKHPVHRLIRKCTSGYETGLPKNRLQILGIGVEGHIGFNEARTPSESQTHLTALADSTLEANKSDYEDGIRTKYAITQGTNSIMNSQLPVLFASGEKKAEAIHGFFRGENPASALLMHPNVHVFVTEDTLSRFSKAELDELTKGKAK